MIKTTVSNKQAAIEFYIDQGFTLFPLHGKVPVKGCAWRDMAFDPFFACDGNFGVQLRPDDLVIDIDPRNGGTASFAALVDVLGGLPATFAVQTGSGGTHLYFRRGGGIKIRKNLKE